MRLLFFLLSILSSLEAQPTLKQWEAMLHFLEEEYLLGIPLHRRLASFHHSCHLFIYSVIFFPMLLWTHEYLFYSLNYQYILLLKLFLVWSLGIPHSSIAKVLKHILCSQILTFTWKHLFFQLNFRNNKTSPELRCDRYHMVVALNLQTDQAYQLTRPY